MGKKPGPGIQPEGDLLDRFARLIDKDFDAALGILTKFGVERFSDLKPAEHAAFGEALTGLNV